MDKFVFGGFGTLFSYKRYNIGIERLQIGELFLKHFYSYFVIFLGKQNFSNF